VSLLLTPQDMGYLRRESARSPMHFLSVMLLESGEPVTIEQLRERVQARLPGIPALRHRLYEPWRGIGRARWVDDPTFDLEAHVRSIDLPTDRDGLCRAASDLGTRLMDRRRPLWQLLLGPPLEDGAQPLLFVGHHALFDGIFSNHAFDVLLGPEPVAPVHLAAPAPTIAERAGDAAAAIGTAVAFRFRRGSEAQPPAANETVLAGPVGPNRAMVGCSIPIASMRTVQSALGGTLYDQYVSMAAGGIRKLLLHRGADPGARPVIAMIPRDTRSDAERTTQGSRTASMLIELPLAVDDAAARLRAVTAATTAAKLGTESHGTLGWRWDVTTTGVTYPQMSLGGRRVVNGYFVVPLQGENRVAITGVRLSDVYAISITVDADAVPDVDVLNDGILDEAGALRSVVVG
jgi:WS/DGAT/MGAT family acyltransferase